MTIPSLLETHHAIEYLAIGDIKPNPKNVKIHTEKDLAPLEAIIRRVGFVNPLIVDEDNNLLAGHGRLNIAQRSKMTHVPVIRLSLMSEADKVAYALAENQIARIAGIDRRLLSEQLNFLIESDFDLSSTGYSMSDVDFVIGVDTAELEEDEGLIFPGRDEVPVSQVGDIWLHGRHRIVCGDCLDLEVVRRAVGDDKAQMSFVDPPYGIGVEEFSGAGRIQHRPFVMGNRVQSDQELRTIFHQSMENVAAVSADGSIHFWCGDWRKVRQLLEAGSAVYDRYMNLICWDKGHGGLGSFYANQYELIAIFKFGDAKHICNFGVGNKGRAVSPDGKNRYRTNIWSHAGLNGFRAGRMEDLKSHPTVKPVPLVMDAILDCSHRNGLVLDVFAGSGTSGLAAHKTGRRAALVELDPIYVDLIIRRFEALTGLPTYHENGQSFAEIRAARQQGEG